MEFVIKNEKELEKVAFEILKNKEKLLLFKGELGAGKTTLIKYLIKKLGANDEISSPTFSLLNTYKYHNNNNIFHFDLYRIKTIEELFDIGIEEYLDTDNYCFIEWADIVKPLIFKEYIEINIDIIENNKRKITF